MARRYCHVLAKPTHGATCDTMTIGYCVHEEEVTRKEEKERQTVRLSARSPNEAHVTFGATKQALK